MANLKNTLGATLLVTGCCIGAGMIGLPVLSVFAGFMPSSAAMLLCYLFTTLTGLLLLEATLWFDNKVNLLSITEFALGKVGKIVTSFLFLFLFYCLFVAFLDGGGQLFREFLTIIFHYSFSREVGILICLSVVVLVTYAGTHFVDRLNRYLIAGLIFSFGTLIFLGMQHVKLTSLTHINLPATLTTIPILLICFGYQNLVPSIAYYLNKNINRIRFAIIIGNLIPLFIYMLWNFVVLGIMPQNFNTTVLHGDMVSDLLQQTTNTLSIVMYVKIFSLFAILTSFLPCAVSFVDFIKDGLNQALEQRSKYELAIYAIVFIPPAACSLVYPHVFLNALGFAGGFIDVILFGVLPATVVLVGRYVKKINGPYRVLGGHVTPISVLILSMIILLMKLQ